MSEAIVTIFVAETANEPAYSRVYRFEYEGPDVITTAGDTGVITLHSLVGHEQLSGNPL